jgi:shikimate kinase
VNLLLIGLRGAGKTVCGAAAATELGMPLVDLDERTASRLGAPSAAEAWRAHGEPGFRRAEADALAEVLAADGRLVACGGGTPTAPGALRLIKNERGAGRARVIYLRAPAAVLAERLRATGIEGRPSLTGAGTLEEVPAILAQRDPVFLDLADLVIQTESHSAAEVTALLVAAARATLPRR